MKIFTRQFIKDLLWSAIFIISMYMIINNPITQPTPRPNKNNWSIQLMQRPLLLGVAGHNYLALRDENEKIVKELHGLPTDPITGDWQYVGTKKTDILKVWEFDGPRNYLKDKKIYGVVLSEGDKEIINNTWTKAENCKSTINEKKLPYPPYGINIKNETINSNSVAYTLAICMGLDTRHIGLLTPGDNNNLLVKQ